MQELEKQFPDPPLLPSSEEHRAEVEDVCQHASGAETTMHCSCLHVKCPSSLRAAVGMSTIVSDIPQLKCGFQLLWQTALKGVSMHTL